MKGKEERSTLDITTFLLHQGSWWRGPSCCSRDQVGGSAAPLALGMSVLLHALETISTLQAQTPTEVLHLGCFCLRDFGLPFAWESLGTY